jgi:hypothetical protein
MPRKKEEEEAGLFYYCPPHQFAFAMCHAKMLNNINGGATESA